MSRIFIAILLALFFPIFVQAQTTRFIEHRVRWMENIYTISKKYNVDPNAILEYNRISANEIRRGIIVRIPVDPPSPNEPEPSDSLLFNDVTNSNYLRGLRLRECVEYQSSPRIEHRASLILPLQLNDTEPNSLFLEFYQGLLLALDDLRGEGMSLRFSTYDSGNYPHLPALVQSGALLNEELLIGPVYANDLFEVLNYTYGQNLKIISPLALQTESAALTNANFFQVNTSLYWQQFNLIQYLLKNSGMVWLFYEEGGAEQELINVTKEILMRNQIVYREFSHKVGDVTGELSQMLTQYQNNQIIVASSDEAFVSDILRNLSFVQNRRNCPITLYGHPRWRNFESVDLDYYHSMNLHLSVSNYVDYQRYEVKNFLARYRAIYHTEPSAYAYQGYDVGYFFLRALYTKGPTFEYCMEQGILPAQPLQSNFRFQRVSPDGGFINTDTRVIRYLPDYRIEILH